MSILSTTRPARDLAAGPTTTSNLGEGRQRFLAQVVENALSSGRRTSKDFIRHFPPADVMRALEGHPRLRANILVPAIGLNEKVALKKSAQSAGEDLQIALDEGVTNEDAIVRLFDPDDRVRYLEDKKLWAFVVEGEFWKAPVGHAPDMAAAKDHVAYLIDCARANGLLTESDVVEGLTLDGLLERLPKADLARLLRAAIVDGRQGRKFDDQALLAAMRPAALLEHISLAQMWESVVVPRIAIPHGFAPRRSQAAPPPLPQPAAPAAPATEEEVVVEVDDPEAGSGAPAAKGPRSRRIGAADLSELKRELDGGGAPKS